MEFKEILQKLKNTPSFNKKGAEFLARDWGCAASDIVTARNILKQEILGDFEDISKPFTSESRKAENGEENLVVVSPKPLNPKEIDEYAQVDNITSFVTSYWLKSNNAGTHTYSVHIKRNITNFYNREELEAKLKELVPAITSRRITSDGFDSNPEEVGILCIADMHAGAQNSELNINGLSYSERDLDIRLQKIAIAAIRPGKKYDTLIIANLGDSVDGWNGYTTRGGHTLGSMSNRDQFDIYFRCMTKFYATLFNSGIAIRYVVHNCLDSNHEGVDFAYICNKNVQNVMEMMYPEVEFIQQFEFINVLEVGIHAIAMTHGKDGKIMKYPMKKILDDKLDQWAENYFKSVGYDDKIKTIIKGDLHLFGYESGKFGNYINVPSVYGTSDYISLHFGPTRPGGLLLELHPQEESVSAKPIWV